MLTLLLHPSGLKIYPWTYLQLLVRVAREEEEEEMEEEVEVEEAHGFLQQEGRLGVGGVVLVGEAQAEEEAQTGAEGEGEEGEGGEGEEEEVGEEDGVVVGVVDQDVVAFEVAHNRQNQKSNQR